MLSVKVYFRVPPGRVRTLALDEGSRTSAALARVLLALRHGSEPETVPLPLDPTENGLTDRRGASAVANSRADAILLIGDRAMFPVGEEFLCEWDLGAEWNAWTGLPFVFALWAGRPGRGNAVLAETLSAARDAGLRDLAAIAGHEAEVLGLPRSLAENYLKHHLHFILGPAERQGLRLFSRLAVEVGLVPRETQRVDNP